MSEPTEQQAPPVTRIDIDSLVAESEGVEAKPATHRHISKLLDVIRALITEVQRLQKATSDLTAEVELLQDAIVVVSKKEPATQRLKKVNK